MTVKELKDQHTIGHNDFLFLKRKFFNKRKDDEEVTQEEINQLFKFKEEQGYPVYKFSFVYENYFKLGDYSQWYSTNISKHWLDKRGFDHIMVLGSRWIVNTQKDKLLDILKNEYCDQLKRCFNESELLNKYGTITRKLLFTTLNRSIRKKTYLCNNNICMTEDQVIRFEKSKPFKTYILDHYQNIKLEDDKTITISIPITVFNVLSVSFINKIQRIYFIAKINNEYKEFYYYFKNNEIETKRDLFTVNNNLLIKYTGTKGVNLGTITINEVEQLE